MRTSTLERIEEAHIITIENQTRSNYLLVRKIMT